MIRFRGKLQWRQYMPDKPVHWGIKLWGLCALCGYLLCFDVYTGATNDGSSDGLATKVVMNMFTTLATSQTVVGIHLYMDNFYSSPTLFYMLAQRGIAACGTMRGNRKAFPNKVIGDKDKDEAGTFRWLQSKQWPFMLAGSWVDNKVCCFLSTIHGPGTTDHTRGAAGGTMLVEKPDVIKAYTSNMGGVDLQDQKRSYYEVRLRMNKWTQHFFMWYVDAATTNAHIIFNDYTKCDGKAFRLRLAYQLVSVSALGKHLAAPLSPADEERAARRQRREMTPSRPMSKSATIMTNSMTNRYQQHRRRGRAGPRSVAPPHLHHDPLPRRQQHRRRRQAGDPRRAPQRARPAPLN